MTPLLKVRLTAGYGQSTILHNLSFDLNPGEALGLIGTSGAGKSTLVLALLGLLPWRGGHATGEVLFEGRNLLTLPEREARQLRGRRFALIPQSPMTALNSALTLQTHFREAWRAHQPAHQTSRSALTTRLQDLIHQMQLPPGPAFLSRRPGEISVGQAQRVLIALALLHSPTLLIADEPTSALDPATQSGIVALLRDLNKQHQTTLLYISHDLTSVLQLSSRIAILDQGSIAECLPADTIGQTARHPATLALLDALPAPPELLRSYQTNRTTRRLASSPKDPQEDSHLETAGIFPPA